ncbi:MAG: hypothetical protein IJK65_11605 [Clostridiales bacterium]|nr:hypothetical protein [Clostridiales bacterium]
MNNRYNKRSLIAVLAMSLFLNGCVGSNAKKHGDQIVCYASDTCFQAQQGDIQVKFYADVGQAPVKDVSLSNKEEKGESAKLLDDGIVEESGDEVPADGVYTGCIVLDTNISADEKEYSYVISVVFTDNTSQDYSLSVRIFNATDKAQFNAYYTDLYLSSYMETKDFKQDSKETRQEKMVELLHDLEDKGYVVKGSIKADSLDSIVYEIDGFGVVFVDYDSLTD